MEPRGFEPALANDGTAQVGLVIEADNPFGGLFQRWERLAQEFALLAVTDRTFYETNTVEAVEEHDARAAGDGDPLSKLVRRTAVILDRWLGGGQPDTQR